MRLQISSDIGADLLIESVISSTVAENENENSNGSSGYSSDVESSTDGQDTEGYSSADVPSSSSAASSSRNSSDNESEDIDGEIAFLRQKQILLHRAVKAMKQEETYAASKARSVLKEDGKTNKKGSPLWVEAKALLSLMNRREEDVGKKRRADTPPPPPTIRFLNSAGYQPRPAKLPKIDISSVKCIPSSDMEERSNPTARICQSMTLNIPNTTSFTPTGPWVTRALVHCLPSLRHQQQRNCSTASSSSQWEIVDDPNLGSLVVPPGKIPLQNSIELKDAMAFTSVPQLVTQSMPPFRVVNANKAFSLFCDGQLPGDTIGRPVESIFQLHQDISTTSPACWSSSASLDNPETYLESQLRGPNKPCRIRVIPVMDHSKKRRDGMSHLLIRIQPSSSNNRSLDEKVCATMKLSSDVGQVTFKSHSIQRAGRHVLGTVG